MSTRTSTADVYVSISSNFLVRYPIKLAKPNTAHGHVRNHHFFTMCGHKTKVTTQRTGTLPTTIGYSICAPCRAQEFDRGEDDIASVDPADNSVTINEPKQKVDLTSYTEYHRFVFDSALGEGVSNDEVYRSTVQPLVGSVFSRGKATCFAYGQTGSGKTYTMSPLPIRTAADMFSVLARPDYQHLGLFVSCFEIYGGKLFDLLNSKEQLICLEDARRNVCIKGLKEYAVEDLATLE